MRMVTGFLTAGALVGYIISAMLIPRWRRGKVEVFGKVLWDKPGR